MADIFDFYVYDDRTIKFVLAEPIMLEDKDVTEFSFRIPKSLNGFDMSSWAWWFVYENAAGIKYSVPMVLVDDADDPENYSLSSVSIGYGMSGYAGKLKFAIEVVNADSGGNVLNEWHTKTYETKVEKTLQGNQVEYSETEADIISALIQRAEELIQLGGGSPVTASTASAMLDTTKVYLYTGDESGYTFGDWYYYNGSEWVSGGAYGSGGGGGLTQAEKNLILELFSKAAYAEDDAGAAYDALEAMWTVITRLVSYNLTHVTSSNTSASVESGQSYTTTLTADTNYSINEVTVTMGGVDITSTAYSSGTITIPSVTGNIVITASAVLAAQSITATYTQSGTVYDTATLDSLKADLVVTANYAGGTSETVPSSDYTLSGTLTEGTSTITVSYAGLTDTFSVTVTQSPLYPLTTGEKIWTSQDRKVSVRDGNIVKGELRSGGSSDMHANISWLSLNGSTPNNTDNNKVGTSKLFTIPSGSSVSIKVTPLTVQYEDAAIGGRSTNIAMRDSTGTNLHTLLGTTAYDTLTVGTPVTDSFTASADLDVWNITMWMQAYSGNKTCTLELEIELTVDGVRFI